MVAAVGRVQVHEHVGVPRIEHGKRRARFGRVGLHVVAVQVESRRVRPGADHFRSVLRAPVAGLRRQPLVAVGVVVGQRDQHDGVEHVGARFEQQVTDQGLEGFLPFHFARVDVALHEHDRTPGPPRRLGRAEQRPGHDHVRQVATLGGLAHHAHSHGAPQPSQAVDERRYALVRRCFHIVRALSLRSRASLRVARQGSQHRRGNSGEQQRSRCFHHEDIRVRVDLPAKYSGYWRIEWGGWPVAESCSGGPPRHGGSA